MRIRSTHTEEGIHLDFVPMVDTLFNLVIFFLLATTIKQAEREMNIALPTAAAVAPISVSMREIIVNVDPQGKVVVAGRPVELEELGGMIKDAVAANPQQKVSIRGDRAASYASVVAVLDVCKTSGVAEPYLDTVLDR